MKILSMVIYQGHQQWPFETPRYGEGRTRHAHPSPISPLNLAKLSAILGPSVLECIRHPTQ